MNYHLFFIIASVLVINIQARSHIPSSLLSSNGRIPIGNSYGGSGISLGGQLGNSYGGSGSSLGGGLGSSLGGLVNSINGGGSYNQQPSNGQYGSNYQSSYASASSSANGISSQPIQSSASAYSSSSAYSNGQVDNQGSGSANDNTEYSTESLYLTTELPSYSSDLEYSSNDSSSMNQEVTSNMNSSGAIIESSETQENVAESESIVSSTSEIQSQSEDSVVSNEKNTCGVDVDFSKSGIRRIKTEFIKGKNIENLILKENEIETISPEAFIGVPELKYLDLSRNNLSVNEFFKFGGHNELKELIFDDNFNMMDMSNGYLEINNYLPKLEYLSLRNVNLNTISNWELYMPKLNFLDASHNKLSLSTFFAALPQSLQKLRLTNAKFDQLCFESSKNIQWLKNIRELYLDENNVRSITSKEYCEPDSNELNLYYPYENNLRILSLKGCSIESIDENAFNYLVSLEDLNLSFNNIGTIYDTVLVRLVNLVTLDLSGNGLVQFPDFSMMENLKTLRLEHLKNKAVFETVNENYWSIRNLEHLSLAGNQMDTVPEILLNHLPSLLTLDLSKNLIKTINVNWSCAPNLIDLNLNNNIIHSFEDINLNKATSLQKLQMNENWVTSFSPKSFRYLPETVEIMYSPASTSMCEACVCAK